MLACLKSVLNIIQMITPDKLPAEVIELLPAGVSEWARLALFILVEQHRGEVHLVTPLLSYPKVWFDQRLDWTKNLSRIGLRV